MSLPLELTGVFVQDPDTSGFTAFFAQLPNIIAEGDTEEEATTNLLNTLRTVFQHQKNVELQQKEYSPQSVIITKSFNFAIA